MNMRCAKANTMIGHWKNIPLKIFANAFWILIFLQSMKTDILLRNTPFGIKELQRKSKNDSQLDRHSNEYTLMPDRVGVAAREPKQNVTIKPYKNQGVKKTNKSGPN